jgi:hypothetical protein
MIHALGFGFLGLGLAGVVLYGLASVAYPVFVIWMIVDGVLRSDAEYPGTEPNRKVLWVLGMVLLNPVAIAYLILVFLKVKRGSLTAPCAYSAPPAR